jgi:hypothetical protein
VTLSLPQILDQIDEGTMGRWQEGRVLKYGTEREYSAIVSGEAALEQTIDCTGRVARAPQLH